MIKAPRGTHDILPSESYRWHAVEEQIKTICKEFGYKEIRTPMFESTELFERGVGDTTDVVQKEMYTFQDKGGRSITLKPEGTSPIVRSFVENSVYSNPQPTKLYYLYPCFRYEKPQAGRLREFHQFGIEVFGSSTSSIDAEVISLAMSLLNRLGVTGIELNINSIGCPVCRKEYNEKLKDFFRPYLGKLCETCRERFEKNPLRILDCKSDDCKKIAKDAPMLIDHICDDCSAHFESLKKYLEIMEIPYNVDATIVRGLDYYTKTVFEIISHNEGSEGTICGGGRYDGLVSEIGGPEMPGVGFGMGLERLLLVLESIGKLPENDENPDIFIANIGDNADVFVQKLIYDLRKVGIAAERDYLARSVKAQMKYANKLQAKFSAVIGDDDISANCVNIKNMTTGESQEVKFSDMADYLKNELK
ncbi:MAG: histidine--tRNA ligase [Clostridia bacterium]|nr:histidine--tRNA ligase [Clostridia bacterium]